MSLVMESDALYWLNWADFVYGMHFFFFLGGGVFLYLCLIKQSIKGDEMTRGQKEKVRWWLTCTKKEEVKKAAHVYKNRT